ncbi:MAG: trypsin-like peptidase domain-containing protein [Bryobacterales bacterium]|nr:trypsin-like peptidase domain-containing protein [Bryobacterales bacterium]MBV9398710.1 trypsin-like peptidase domain-containing protein [Bryobacterales bacterium]
MRYIRLSALSVLIACPAFPQAAAPGLRELSASFESLAARVRPAVVQIFSTGYAAAEENNEGANTGNLLTRQTATGSGVILTPDGYIVTNNHVIEGARKIEVKLAMRDPGHSQEMRLPAKVVGADRQTDLAVVKIERDGLPTLPLGDSNALRQGQVVMAFGNPLGLEGSASTGIISSTSRRVKQDDPRAYIQTDAPINPGNSGGPLVDTEGRVVGINTFIITQSGGSEGIGFSVPSNTVKMIYDQIRKDGHVHRGHIGISVQTVNSILAKGLGLSQDWGAVVSDLEHGGPAEVAGIKIGDIIESVNGKEMEDAGHLEEAIFNLGMAGSANLNVIREGMPLRVTVTVHETEDDPERFADMVDPQNNLVPQLGILAIELNDNLTSMLTDLRHGYGLVVAARSPSPPYTGASLELGDVIYEINHSPTLTVKFLREKLNQMKAGDAVVLQVERDGKLMYVPLELD